MKILVAWECSGAVRRALRRRGHNAWSVDLKAAEDYSNYHIQDDIKQVLKHKWDGMIGFPPCTYLAISGLHRNLDDPVRQQKTMQALDFFKLLHQADIKKIALENPMGCVSSRYTKYSQIIFPYQFGVDSSKKTCLWLKNLPLLRETERINPRIVEGKPRWGNQLDSGHCAISGKNRQADRARMPESLAEAMAEQWFPREN